MTQYVDHDRIRRYIQRDLDEEERAEVRRLVREEPEWARALKDALALEMALFDVADAIAAERGSAPAASRVVSWRPAWSWLALPFALAVAAVLWVRANPGVDYEATRRVVWTAIPSSATCEREASSGGAFMAPADAGGTAALCAGDRLEILVRPERPSAWVAPVVEIDGRSAGCEVEPTGTEGSTTVTCTAGVDLPLDGAPHHLAVRVGRVIVFQEDVGFVP